MSLAFSELDDLLEPGTQDRSLRGTGHYLDSVDSSPATPSPGFGRLSSRHVHCHDPIFDNDHTHTELDHVLLGSDSGACANTSTYTPASAYSRSKSASPRSATNSDRWHEGLDAL